MVLIDELYQKEVGYGIRIDLCGIGLRCSSLGVIRSS